VGFFVTLRVRSTVRSRVQLINDKNDSAEVMAVDISDDVLICDEDDLRFVINITVRHSNIMMLCLTVILINVNPDVIGDKNHQITVISADEFKLFTGRIFIGRI